MATANLTASARRPMIADHVRAMHHASARQNAAMGEAICAAIIVEHIRSAHAELPKPFTFIRKIDVTVRDEDIVDLTNGTGYRDITPPDHIAAQALNKGQR